MPNHRTDPERARTATNGHENDRDDRTSNGTLDEPAAGEGRSTDREERPIRTCRGQGPRGRPREQTVGAPSRADAASARRGGEAAEARKERVLHTRISEQLSDDIRRLAEDLRVPTSNLVRNVLEEVFAVVESVSDDVGDLFEDVLEEAESARSIESGRRRRHRSRHSRPRAQGRTGAGETPPKPRFHAMRRRRARRGPGARPSPAGLPAEPSGVPGGNRLAAPRA